MGVTKRVRRLPSRYGGRPGAGHDSKDARPPLPPLCERSLICSMRLFAPRLQSAPGLIRALLIPPSWSGPAFLLPLLTRPTQKGFSTNFALTGFSEIREKLRIIGHLRDALYVLGLVD
jgi:hypothetical protein